MPAKPTKQQSRREQFAKRVHAFAADVGERFGAKAHGEPEAQLGGPIENLIRDFSALRGAPLVAKPQSQLEGRAGRPDLAIGPGDLPPIGYMELKAPGKGADPGRYTGHDRRQWEIFRNLPNILYTDGDSWALYRDGVRVGGVLRLDVDFQPLGSNTPAKGQGEKLYDLLETFVGWRPIVPSGAKELAAFLAPYCRLLRDAVAESLESGSVPLGRLKGELEALLFPGVTGEQFADSYAQTVLFALLLARMGGADTLDILDAVDQLGHTHVMLSRSLQFLTDESVRVEIDTALSAACRVVSAIEPSQLKTPPSSKDGQEDPWLFFYEHFLAAYDPELRKQAGAYYTPLQVVRCQVRLVEKILMEELDRDDGFLGNFLTLDPAAGTGTYLMAIVEHALAKIKREMGAGAVKTMAGNLTSHLRGFEWLTGPFAVAQLRMTQLYARYGAAMPKSGVYLTNTLASPTKAPPASTMFHEPIAREYRLSSLVRDADDLIVIMGNPPYGRHAAGAEANQAATGAWVRYGDRDGEYASAPPILDDFLVPARKAGLGVHLKNLYNQYVYFIRWALWRAFEHEFSCSGGIVSFITASSYLDGDAFVGLRRHMRKVCERIDIIDLGGDARGTHKEENIFDIQTPVCIFFAWRKQPKAPKKGQITQDSPRAKVRYLRVRGTREEKLAFLDSIKKGTRLPWQDAQDEWNAPFTPKGVGEFFDWPLLKDIMPWQSNGVQCSRKWPIAADEGTLAERWSALCKSKDRAEAFKEGRDLEVSSVRASLFNGQEELPAVKSMAKNADMEPTIRYAYRSFDRQYLLADARIITRPRPPLWSAHGDRQIYFASIFTQAIGLGPALTCSSNIPDLDFFRGSFGAKAVLPLFHDAGGQDPNVSDALLNFLSKRFEAPKESRVELAIDIAAYAYALLAQPAYSDTFQTELARKEVRVPLTKDKELFYRVASFGRRLIHLHTYGERLQDAKKSRQKRGRAKCVEAVPDAEDGYPEAYSWEDGRLRVGQGVFSPVAWEVYGFEVSGLKVVQSWLGYRMKSPKGKKSSPLDAITPRHWAHAFTAELLELLWLLEATLDGYAEQGVLLREVIESPLYTKTHLPPVADGERRWRGDGRAGE
jgi:hypothetical protein